MRQFSQFAAFIDDLQVEIEFPAKRRYTQSVRKAAVSVGAKHSAEEL